MTDNILHLSCYLLEIYNKMKIIKQVVVDFIILSLYIYSVN